MAFLTINFYSHELKTDSEFCVVLPNDGKAPFRTVYLLHGLENDHTIWTRLTSVERYANEMGLAIIMPNASRSFYTDMAYGRRYYSYISQELFDYTRSILNLSSNREDTFIAGFSMGGYGALKIAFRNPEKFSAVASLSGAVDMGSKTMKEVMGDELHLIYGDMGKFYGSLEDVFHLANSYSEKGADSLRIYQTVGKSDYLYGDNQNFRKIMENRPSDFIYEEDEGDHTWDFCDKHIKRVLEFFCKK